MDLATVIGLPASLLLLAAALAFGDSPGAFFNMPSVLLVLLGTVAVTMVCFNIRELRATPGVVAKTMLSHLPDAGLAATQMLELAEHARKEGVLALQNGLDRFSAQTFLHKGLTMVIDGSQSEDVERLLSIESSAMHSRHIKSASVLRKAADISPAMGLIGTLIGLVQMLGTLDDPSRIGPAMAVALLTTFYGAVLANMVFSPLAAKLERNADEEALLNQLYTIAAASISRQENPRRLEMQLNTILPPAKRLHHFD